MIFATDDYGDITYISPEWAGLTGRTVADALKRQWLTQTHPADRAAVQSTLKGAVEAQTPFSLHCRLRRADGSYVWVAAGGVPSFGASDHAFVGFMGSIAELGQSHTEGAQAYGTIGRSVTPQQPPLGRQTPDLDAGVDQLLTFKSVLINDEYRSLLQLIDTVLCLINRKLAAKTVTPPVVRLQ